MHYLCYGIPLLNVNRDSFRELFSFKMCGKFEFGYNSSLIPFLLLLYNCLYRKFYKFLMDVNFLMVISA